MMPTTLYGRLLSVTVWPMTLGFAPKARCHSPWPSTTTCSRPCCSSSAEKVRPFDACARSTEKKSDETAAPETGTGRSEEHTSELQSRQHLVCRLLLEKIDN